MKTEIESKNLLKRYGIATSEPVLARNAREAAELARSVEAPMAMKIVSSDIVHKAAVGGVRLNVGSEDAARVFEEIMAACRKARPEARLEGVLLEKMAGGNLEVFIGARVDREYGAVVMFGLGGANVEQGPPPAVALAPLTETLAEELVGSALGGELAKRLSPSARQTLKAYLMAVAGADGMLLRERLGELDINPIIVDGASCLAVDAVAEELPAERAERVLGDGQIEQAVARRRARLHGLGALFSPGSIAFVGASTARNKLGYRSIRNLLDFGFRGSIYPIHPSAPEICGLPAYKSILEVPEPVDRAYVAVAAAQVPEVLADCARKGVKVAQVLTAGFSEWSGGEGRNGGALEGEIKKVLAGTDMRMVGPNCIGTFSAASRIAMGAPRYCPSEPGGITFISQSGTFAGDVVRRAQVLNVPVGQVLSCGNCSDLDLVDYLLFCEDDPATTLTAFYIESLRDPGLFFRAAERARKPVVILKGGTTEQGLTAASSHTAALATDRTLWNAALRQAGILQVDNIDELMDALLIHSAHGTLKGNRLGIFGSGGGVSVTSADAAARAGMVVPPLQADTGRALQRFGVPGTSVANPIDIPVWGLRDGDRFIVGEIIDLLKRDANIDSVVVYVEMGSIMDFADTEQDGLRELEGICDSVMTASREGPKVSLALRSTGDKVQDDFVRDQRVRLLEHGIAVFASTARAVRAHAKLWTLSRRAV